MGIKLSTSSGQKCAVGYFRLWSARPDRDSGGLPPGQGRAPAAGARGLRVGGKLGALQGGQIHLWGQWRSCDDLLFQDIVIPEEARTFSSPTVEQMLPFLRRRVLPVTMNMHGEWTLEPWHIQVTKSLADM